MSKYKVINIPEEDYNMIKKYCEKEALKISKWLVKIAKEKIDDK